MNARFDIFHPIDSTGEFFANLLENICHGLYSGIYWICERVFKSLFSTLNDKVVWASEELTTQNPKTWNADAFHWYSGLRKTD